MAGIDLIVAERQRQIEQEGFTDDHDLQHTDGSLGQAAAFYAYPPDRLISKVVESYAWPKTWDARWMKKDLKSRKRQLAVAGALCAAEIDRIELLERAGI